MSDMVRFPQDHAGAVLAEVAARYGATVAPDAVVQRVAMGASARPLPVWDGKKLIISDWKEQDKARRKAAVKRAQITARRNRAFDAEVIEHLSGLHAAGALLPAMAQAMGLSQSMVRRMLAAQGLAVPRAPRGPLASTQAQMASIRRLVADGRSEAEIGAALGLSHQGNRRKRIRAAVPEFAFGDARRKTVARGGRRGNAWAEKRAAREALIRDLVADGADMARLSEATGIVNRNALRRAVRAAVPGHAFPAPPRLDLSERDAAVAALVREKSFVTVAEQLGISHAQVAASVRRLRVAGVLPSASDAPMPRRSGQGRGRPDVVASLARRNEGVIAAFRAGDQVEDLATRFGITRTQVARIVRSAGLSIVDRRRSVGAARRAELLELVATGLCAAAIAARWGVNVKTVYGMASRLGISMSEGARLRRRAHQAERKSAQSEVVRLLYQRGCSIQKIGDALGISKSSVHRHIADLGLSGQRKRRGGGGGDAPGYPPAVAA